MTTTWLPEQHSVYEALCPCRSLLDLLANKWSTLAIGALEDAPQRFGALQRELSRGSRRCSPRRCAGLRTPGW